MATIDEIRKNRLKKLEKIESAYPVFYKRTHTCFEALKNKTGQIYVTGRIISLREHGSIVFVHIKDETDKLQLVFRKNSLGEKSFQYFLDYFDIGDFVQAKGKMFKTKKGEKTLDVLDYKILAKSLLPLPEKWHGLEDIEQRYRKRYLDLIFNNEVQEKFRKRSEIIKNIRKFLENKGFLEVETPILQPLYGGATARPFKTHLNALNMDLYLRISPELYLKRLLVGGFEKVFEIGKCFRNEGLDKEHNPDFTMLEFYWAYADYKDLMKLTEEMFKVLLKNIFKKLEIIYKDNKINFKTPWTRIEFVDLFKKYTNINLDEINESALAQKAKELGISVKKGDYKFEIADNIYKKYCRPKIIQPTFVIHHPVESSPLAKQLDSKKLARFQLLVGGMEIINAFSELNNPIEQKRKFQEQEKVFKKGFEEAQRLDEDYIEALEYGMPLAAGFGMGIDRLVVLLTDSSNLREVILFPIMKNKK
ncbi:MAG: lysine--tRNA ligase [Candidatus Pacebacteria bacterium]|nr:lysine--tRNA ligase [Candidatus Paceibacterota bacterium]